LIVRMQLLTPQGRGPNARQTAVLHSQLKRESFWKIEEPEIAAVFASRDVAYFETERVNEQEIRIIRRVEDED
jgi:hypothetical protein